MPRLYKPHRVHVIRFFVDGRYMRLCTTKNFTAARRGIRERHGPAAAASAVSWGWQIPPIT